MLQLLEAETPNDLTLEVYSTLLNWKSTERINCITVGERVGVGRNKVKAMFRWFIKNGFMERIRCRLGTQWNTVLRLTKKRIGQTEEPVDWLRNVVIPKTKASEPRPLCLAIKLPMVSGIATNKFTENREKTSRVMKCIDTSSKVMRKLVSDWDDLWSKPVTKRVDDDFVSPFAEPTQPKAKGKAAARRETKKAKNYLHRNSIPVKDWTTKHICQEFRAMYEEKNPMVAWNLYDSRFLFAWADFRAAHHTDGEDEMYLLKWFFANPAGWFNKTPEHSWRYFIQLADRNIDMVTRRKNQESDMEDQKKFIEEMWGES